jgi:hypothetical protein
MLLFGDCRVVIVSPGHVMIGVFFRQENADTRWFACGSIGKRVLTFAIAGTR